MRKTLHPFIFSRIATISLALAVNSPATPAITDADWKSMGGYPGVDGAVTAVAIDSSGNIYAGGHFIAAGGVVANHIAKWDGSSWSALGGGTDSAVLSLAIDRSGTVYAGGYFHRAGTAAVNHIAKWNGSAWSALGGGVTGTAASVAALTVDKSGDVYAAGYFDWAGGINARNIAKWDGSAWSALGGGVNRPYRQFYGPDAPYVTALSLDTAGNLYAGGWFDSAGNVAANHIAQWDGGAWSALGSGTNNNVAAIATDRQGNLYAGGLFDTAGGGVAKHLAHWNGSTWRALDTLQRSVNANKIALVVDKSDNLYALGEYFIAKWQGAAWSTFYNQTIPSAYGAAADNAGNIYIGGGSLTLGSPTLNGILKWNGSALSTLGIGTNGPVSAVVADGSGSLYVGGGFSNFCGTPAKSVAKWNGSAWSALGDGINGGVTSLKIDKSGNLYAAGFFDSAGGGAANNIAKWDGSAWSALGDGINGGGSPEVAALSFDASGNLYAAGYFSSAGGVAARNIAKWDGRAWSALDSGITLCEDCEIYDLAADHAGNLYVGGNFFKAGNVSVNNIARWNGSSWSALGSGAIGFKIYALVADRSGNLYAGGYNGGEYRSVARWDGSTWSALGKGMNGSVYSIALDSSGNVYAGGSFDTVYRSLDSTNGKTAVSRIAKWDGGAWSALGSGVSGQYRNPSVLTFDKSGVLWVGGDFSIAGGKVSPCIAQCSVVNTAALSPRGAIASGPSFTLDPRAGRISFSLRCAADATCRILTLSGREVLRTSRHFSPGGHTVRINRGLLAQGAYFVHFKAGSESMGWLMDVWK